MRIGFTVPAWPGHSTPNGITTAVAEIINGMREIGHECTVIPFKNVKKDADVIPVPPQRPLTNLERLCRRLGFPEPVFNIMAWRIVEAARRAVVERGIEILVMEESHGYAEIVQRNLSIPVVVVLHGPWFLIGPMQSQGLRQDARRERREARAIRSCAGVIAPSADLLRRAEAVCGPFRGPSAAIPNAIALKPPVDYAALAPAERRNLLFVGRYDRTKGADVLFEAFARLIDDGIDARLTFVGPDPGARTPDGRIVHVAEALAALPEAARARIDYLGPKSKAEIDALRRRHAAAIVASRYENFPYALLESLSAGAGTVCTAAGGQLEIARSEETALVVPAEDPVALASACRRLLEEPGLAARLGAAARVDVAARFAPPRVAERMAEFLSEVVSQARRTALSTRKGEAACASS